MVGEGVNSAKAVWTIKEMTVRAARRIRHLLELIRFSHTVFALPFALLAAAMAMALAAQQERPSSRPPDICWESFCA